MADQYDYLAPCLRLFVSLDIQGSTSFKYQSASDKVGEWLPIIHWFYIDTQDAVQRSWLKIAERYRHDFPRADAGAEPRFWKAAGDELLFVKEITDPLQCLTAILAFRDIQVQQDAHLQRRSEGRLKLKATAWLAGFPNLNKELPLVGSYAFDAEAPSTDTMLRIARIQQGTLPHQRDFVGPSIDLGFRLTDLATPRRFIVSVELAYMLADMMIEHDLMDRLNIQVEEGRPLRGILGDKDYPLIWIDTLAHRLPRTSFEKLISHGTCSADVLRDVCCQFISENPILVMPYVVAGEGCIYGAVPKAHSDMLATMKMRIAQERGKEEQFVSDQTTKDGSGSLDAKLSQNLERLAAKVRGNAARDDRNEP